MVIVNIQDIVDKALSEALSGKKISVQPNIDPQYHGKVIDYVMPCSIEYGDYDGYMIKMGGGATIFIHSDFNIGVE